MTFTLRQIVGAPPRRSCDGKHPHRSKGAADAAIRAVTRAPNFKPSDRELESYLCRHCGRWHVGHGAPAKES